MVGVYLSLLHRFHFPLRQLKSWTHSETGGQRSQGLESPPESGRMKTGGGEETNIWKEKGKRRRKRMWGHEQKNKRWKNESGVNEIRGSVKGKIQGEGISMTEKKKRIK